MDIGKVYRFNTKSPVFLGEKYDNVKLVSISQADMLDVLHPVKQVWQKVYPTLPSGTPSDPNSGHWYVFKPLSGDLIYLSEYFIDENSIVEVTAVSIAISIPSAALSDVARVTNALKAAGFIDFVVTTN
mgnify:CR=1 FL=1